MVKYREILRLTHLGISQENIAFSCGCARSTVQLIQKLGAERGLAWPLPDEMDDAAIRKVLYPPKPAADAGRHPIDHEWVEREMGRPGVTMTLLWGEYCVRATDAGAEPFMYSAFCQRHRQWAKSNAVTMHIDRRPAQEMQVDWAGTRPRWCDPDTGEVRRAYVFVSCLPFSAAIFARPYPDMGEESWIDGHIRSFRKFGGSAPILVPDNCKTGVLRNTVEELVVNEQYRRMAEHYGCAVVPARVRRPKDKAAVEMSVGVVERRVIAALRDRVFIGLGELAEAIEEAVDAVNAAPFQKRAGSRWEVFLGQEKDLLQPLPPAPYVMTARKTATVQFNYHVSFDKRYYSVPFPYVRREVAVVATRDTVAIACDGERIALHRRSYGPEGAYVTDPAHMPDAHRDWCRVERRQVPQLGRPQGGVDAGGRRRHPQVEEGGAAGVPVGEGPAGTGRPAWRRGARARVRQGADMDGAAELQDGEDRAAEDSGRSRTGSRGGRLPAPGGMLRPIRSGALGGDMANEATMDKLYQMRLSVMARAYREQEASPTCRSTRGWPC